MTTQPTQPLGEQRTDLGSRLEDQQPIRHLAKSYMGGAGKFTTDVNLAQDAASLGYQVRLIDPIPSPPVTASALGNRASGENVGGGADD